MDATEKRGVLLPVPGKMEAKKTDEGKLYIEGYASVFDVTDYDGDRVVRGAFKKTIEERVAKGQCALMVRHMVSGGDSTEAIGKIVEGKEDDIGFWIRAELFDTQLAHDSHKKVNGAPDLFGMSIGGYWVQTRNIEDEGGKATGLEIQEVKLLEVTLTMLPSNEATMGTVVAKMRDLEATVGELAEKIDGKAEPPSTGTTEPAASHSRQPEINRNQRRIALLGLEVRK